MCEFIRICIFHGRVKWSPSSEIVRFPGSPRRNNPGDVPCLVQLLHLWQSDCAGGSAAVATVLVVPLHPQRLCCCAMLMGACSLWHAPNRSADISFLYLSLFILSLMVRTLNSALLCIPSHFMASMINSEIEQMIGCVSRGRD